MSDSVFLILEWYRKNGDKLIGEEKIDSLTMDKACELIGLNSKDYPLLQGCYKLSNKEAKCFQKFVIHNFNLSKYQYFIGAYQNERNS